MNEGQNSVTPGKPNHRKKWIIAGAGVVTAGLLSYFGWHYWQKKKSESDDVSDDSNSADSDGGSSTPPPIPKVVANDDFPLKKGSKGANVKLLQESLIAKYGKSIMPRYGADGGFGAELQAALKKLGLPESIDETTFNVLVKGSSPDPSNTAQKFYDALGKQDLNTTLALLRAMRNPDDYKAVSDKFLEMRFNGVRQTLVNGLMSTFPDERLKQMVSLALTKIGLKYDGNKWSLSGFGDKVLLITNCASRVWNSPTSSVAVPPRMVLGTKVAMRGDHVLFENDNQYFIILNKHVNTYKQ